MSSNDKCQDTSWTAAALAQHMREDHEWRLHEHEETDLDALRAMHRVAVEQAPAERTWWIDGENTHGIQGLACISPEYQENMGGMGPDDEFTGTVAELVEYLVEGGYDDLETDDDELAAAWGMSGDVAAAM